MTRYSHLRWLAPLGGLVAAALIALSAAPAERDDRLPDRDKAPEPVLHECAADGHHRQRHECEGQEGDPERRRRTERLGRRHHSVLLQVRQDDQLRLADADGHDRLLPGRDLAAEPVLQRSKDTERVGQHLRSGAVHELSLPALRQQPRRIGARAET